MVLANPRNMGYSRRSAGRLNHCIHDYCIYRAKHLQGQAITGSSEVETHSQLKICQLKSKTILNEASIVHVSAWNCRNGVSSILLFFSFHCLRIFFLSFPFLFFFSCLLLNLRTWEIGTVLESCKLCMACLLACLLAYIAHLKAWNCCTEALKALQKRCTCKSLRLPEKAS